MKKALNCMLIALLCISAVMVLSACGNPDLMYNKTEYPKNEIEEIIESDLEMQNPRFDLNVTITSELE